MSKYNDICISCGHQWDVHTVGDDGPCHNYMYNGGEDCYCLRFLRGTLIDNKELKLKEIKNLEEKLLDPNLDKNLIELIEARIEELELSGNEPYLKKELHL